MDATQLKPLVIILLGPPGSGKGTHAIPLSQELSLPHISTGDLFRQHIRNETPLGVQAKRYIDLGNLVPDELVLAMLFERMEKEDCESGYILDGFPRTVPQAKELSRHLTSHRVIAFNFTLSDAKIIERVTGRLACKSCGRPYHKKFDPPKNPTQCDLCATPLIQRQDDREEIIRKRLEVYREQTEPLIAYYEKEKGVLKTIDSDQSKAQVFHSLLEALAKSGWIAGSALPA